MLELHAQMHPRRPLQRLLRRDAGYIAALTMLAAMCLSLPTRTNRTASIPPPNPSACGATTNTGDATTQEQSIANMDDVLLMQAGTSVRLGVATSDPNVSPGGDWTAEYGTIDASGSYTAPSYTPGLGLDMVTYTDPYGTVLTVQVFVQSNPNIPGSEQTPYIQAPWSFSSPSEPPAESSEAPASEASAADTSGEFTPAQMTTDSDGNPVAIDDSPYDSSLDMPPSIFEDKPTTVVEPGGVPAPPVQTNYAQTLSSEVIDGTPGYRLSATRADSTRTNAIFVVQQSVVTAPLVAKVDPGPMPGGCTNGELRASYTPYTVTRTPLPPMIIGTIHGTAGIDAQIFKAFGIHISIGADYPIKGFYFEWKRTRKKNVYKCINGQWIYQYTRTCTSYAHSLETDPKWGILFFSSYPRNGQPGPYGPEVCN